MRDERRNLGKEIDEEKMMQNAIKRDELKAAANVGIVSQWRLSLNDGS